MDFLISHFDEKIELHRSNKPFMECVMTGWNTFDKYNTKIDETGAHAAAGLLHPKKGKTYLPAVSHGKSSGESQVYAMLKTCGLLTRSTMQLGRNLADAKSSGSDSDHEQVQLTAYDVWRLQRSKKIQVRSSQQSEFHRFVIAPADSIVFSDRYRVLGWWKESSQQHTYPRLARMAIDLLSAPVMSAEAERVFSKARQQITFDKSLLNGDTIAERECLRSWQIEELVDDAMAYEEALDTGPEDKILS